MKSQALKYLHNIAGLSNEVFKKSVVTAPETTLTPRAVLIIRESYFFFQRYCYDLSARKWRISCYYIRFIFRFADYEKEG